MNGLRITLGILLFAALLVGRAVEARAQPDRVADDFARLDANNDGKLNADEWNRRGNFAILDVDGDGALTLKEVRALYAGHDDKSYTWKVPGPRGADNSIDASVFADRLGKDALDMETLCAIGRSRKCDAEPSMKRGMIETGLGPVFPQGIICPGIDDTWAMDYGFKRSREAYHGGIDLPAKWGTPMLAVAAGTVVGVFKGEDSARGMEVVLRHSPADTGLALWVYTQYGHMDAIPDLTVGQRVRMGQYLGPTGNSGVSGMSQKQTGLRRPAIHFAVFYSTVPKFAEVRDVIIPVDGRWMDPIGFYRQTPPFESAALKALPDADKGASIPVMLEDGGVLPTDTKLIWPYACKRP